MVGVAALRDGLAGPDHGRRPGRSKQKAIMRPTAGRTTASRSAICTIAIIASIPSASSSARSRTPEINQAAGAKDTEKQHLMALIFGAISKNILNAHRSKGRPI
jgi:hypothetical protein